MAFKRTKKQKNVIEVELRDWSGLPYDILELICRKLHYIDQLKSRAVCKSWSAINGVPSLKQEIPWLLTFNYDKDDDDDDDDEEEEEDDDEYSCKAIDPNYDRTYKMSMNIIKEKNLINLHVHESKYGWLLISSQPTPEPPNGSFSREYPSGTSFFLFTPFLTNNNFIELPIHNSPFSIATFSSEPSNEDFILLTMYSISDITISISTFSLGGDSSWKAYNFDCDFPLVHVKSLVYSNGDFFCSSPFGRIGIFNVAHKDWTVLPEPETPVAAFHTLADVNVRIEILEVYLVKSDTHKEDNEEEIFLVYLKNIPCPFARLRMCMFRLDRTQMIWERLHTIGSRIMFLGSGCTSFVRRSYESKDRIYYIWGNKMKHCTVSVAIRSYPCNIFYGPLSKKLSTKVWIEPPLHC